MGVNYICHFDNFLERCLIKVQATTFVFFRLSKNEKMSCGIYCRALCITRNFSKSQNLRFIIKSGFKPRAGYNGTRTVIQKQFTSTKYNDLLLSSLQFHSKSICWFFVCFFNLTSTYIILPFGVEYRG